MRDEAMVHQNLPVRPVLDSMGDRERAVYISTVMIEAMRDTLGTTKLTRKEFERICTDLLDNVIGLAHFGDVMEVLHQVAMNAIGMPEEYLEDQQQRSEAQRTS